MPDDSRKSDAYKIQLTSEDGCGKYYPKLIINKTTLQLDSASVNVFYLTYRWFHAALQLIILLVSIFEVDDPTVDLSYYFKWPLYLTNWAICFNVVQALMGVIVVIRAVCWGNSQADAQKNVEELRFLRLYWSLQSSAVTIAFGVSIMYWGFIYNPEIHVLNVPNVASHLLNSIVMSIDFLMSGHSVRFSYVIYPLVFVSSYIVFSLIYYAFGGLSREGDLALYKAMDWRRPAQCLVFLGGGYGVILSTFIVVWLTDKMKRRLVNALKQSVTTVVEPARPASPTFASLI